VTNKKGRTRMWSLPDINRMNAEASRTRKSIIEQASTLKDEKGEALACDCCEQPATSAEVYFDIFSDDPKGVVAECEEHEGQHEGHFTCDGCERLMVENYTWELYYVHTKDGEMLCLKCWAERVLEDKSHVCWVELTDEKIAAVNFALVSKAPHIRAVGQDVPKGLVFVDNVELDGASGGRLTGTMSSEPGPDGGVRDLQVALREARSQGFKWALLVLDAAFQFSVSVGVYGEVKSKRRVRAKKLVPVQNTEVLA
jgi:hypothetical protein